LELGYILLNTRVKVISMFMELEEALVVSNIKIDLAMNAKGIYYYANIVRIYSRLLYIELFSDLEICSRTRDE